MTATDPAKSLALKPLALITRAQVLAWTGGMMALSIVLQVIVGG